MPHDRRRQRSTRVLVASVLLAAAAVLVTSAVVVASQALLVVAAVVTLLTGFGAARIISNELAQTRREWARDRALQAKAYQGVLARRTREQAEFAVEMSERVAIRDARITELNGTVRLAEARADEATTKADAEKRRSVELEGRVDTLLGEREEIAEIATLWDGADVPTIVDLLRWEETAGSAAAQHADHADLDDRREA